MTSSFNHLPCFKQMASARRRTMDEPLWAARIASPGPVSAASNHALSKALMVRLLV